MTDTCFPPPELRDVDGWHWLALTSNPDVCVLWRRRTQCWVFGYQNESPIQVASYGYTYKEKAYTPAEVAELRADGERLRRALEDMHSGWIYIRRVHGNLYGVGWDRCDKAARIALEPKP